MVYIERKTNTLKEFEILDSGVYKDIKYVILSFYTHPCAYIENILNVKSYYDKKLKKAPVHKKFTYLGKVYWDKNDKGEYLGWDYAHNGDYNGADDISEVNDKRFDLTGKKYTTSEVLKDVYKVIDWIIKNNK